VTIGGTVEPPALHPNAVGLILRSRAAEAGIMSVGMERLSSHGLRAGFVMEAYKPAAKDEEIMAHTRHQDLKTMRGHVLRAKLTDNPAKLLGFSFPSAGQHAFRSSSTPSCWAAGKRVYMQTGRRVRQKQACKSL
jgi:hypothetical protein